MSDMQINQVLAQIRAFSQQVQPPATSGASGAQAAVERPGASGADFGALLKRGIDQVSQSQQTATDVATQFERGAAGVDLPQVMIEMQKASVSFRALVEVRNRLVSVYQDIMNMQM
jgi:flagellar hook-basal body complex protein FliE